MEKILFRKFLFDCLSFFLITLLSASVIVWVFQAVNLLDIVIEDGRNYLTYLKITMLNFPKILSKLIPFSFFFSFSFVIVRYEMNNELMIYWNFGISKIKIVNFFLYFSFLIMIFQLLFTTYLVPNFQNKARSYVKTSDINFFKNFTRPKKFNDTLKDLTIFSEDLDKDGNLLNIYMKKKISANEFQITYSKKGKFETLNGSEFLVLSEGETITSNKDNITTFTFSKSNFNLSNLKSHFTTYTKTQEINTLELLECIKYFLKKKNSSKIKNCNNEKPIPIILETYKRFIVPMYLPVLMLVAMLLIVFPKENQNYKKIRYATFFLGFIIIIFSETTLRLLTSNIFQNILLSLLPIIFVLGLYTYLLNKFSFKKK